MNADSKTPRQTRWCGNGDIIDAAALPTPILTVLNFSGGRQSSALLWMVLRGDIPTPPNFIVLNADPGMENSETYHYVADMKRRCEARGIYFETVAGPNLYEDLVQLGTSDRVRLDNPPYWTTDPITRKGGRLRQKCTREYKIRPMDRAVRRILRDRYDIGLKSSRIGNAVVEKWIGFTASETSRIKMPGKKYLRFAYPLVDMGLTNADVEEYYATNELPMPPRSVCNACFANGLDTLATMYRERPDDWAAAVAVDDAVRDLSQIGVTDEIYVSATRRPLRELAATNFALEDDEDAQELSCDSGYCFT